MQFKVDPKIFREFPGVRIGVLVLLGIENRKGEIKNNEIIALLREEEKKKKKELIGVDIKDLPEINLWREYYQKFGSKPREYHSSVGALLRRVQAGNPLPSINSLVDLYNYLSIKYILPAGAEDLDKAKGDIWLTFAKGDEIGRCIGGKEVETCYKGEVIYKDDLGFICRRWNWREAERTKIDEETQNAALVLEALPSVSDEKFKEALKDAKNLVQQFLDGELISRILTEDDPELEVDFETGRKAREEKAQVEVKEEKKKEVKEKIGVKPLKKITDQLTDKSSISYKLREPVWRVAKGFDKKLKLEDVYLEHPAQETHGDYATNIAMTLAKKIRKAPMELAEQIIESFPKVNIISKVEVVKPGFINFWLGEKYLCEQLDDAVRQKEKFGKSNAGESKKIMIEFAHPNTHKLFHIGHLRNIILGESISRILKVVGFKIVCANYQGDVGLHIAKCLWGWKNMENLERELEELENPSLSEKKRLDVRMTLIGRCYLKGNKAYENDERAKKEIVNLNRKIYERDKSVMEWWEETRGWSLDYFGSIYDRVYTKFDRLYFESEVAMPGKKIVLENLKKGIFEESEGAVIFNGEKCGLHKRVFINKEGLPTYEAKDMDLGRLQFEEYNPDLIVHVVGPEQTGYFQVVFKALEQIMPETKGKEYHRVYGWVRLKEGKMGSRLGNVVLGKWLLDGVKKRLVEEFRIEEDEKAEAIAVGAVKYSMLKLDPITELVFDIDESISLEGNSGPYLQYTYARAKSVLRKAKTKPFGLESFKPEGFKIKMNEEELVILRTIYQFPEVILESAKNFAPNLICNFLFDLAQKFNTFYNCWPIIKAEKKEEQKFRLLLTASVAQILGNGLTLLGIETLGKM